jgi:KUP system potassium uptake protein
VPGILRSLAERNGDGAKPVATRLTSTTFYLGRETLIASAGRDGAASRPSTPRMARWRKKLFILMTRNAQSATAFFGLPPNRVVELGAQIQF